MFKTDICEVVEAYTYKMRFFLSLCNILRWSYDDLIGYIWGQAYLHR